MDVYEALRLIATRSVIAEREALSILAGPQSAVQERYNRLALRALGHSSAGWTREERDNIIRLIEPVPGGGPES